MHRDFRVVVDFAECVFVFRVHLDAGAREDDIRRGMRRFRFDGFAVDGDGDGLEIVLRETGAQRHSRRKRKAQSNITSFGRFCAIR